MSETSTAVAEVVKPSIPAPKPEAQIASALGKLDGETIEVKPVFENRYRVNWRKPTDSGIPGLVFTPITRSAFVILHEDGRIENRG